MTSSHQGQKIAEALWRRLSLKKVHLYSGSFVIICVHSWFLFIDDRLSFLVDSPARAGARTYPESSRDHLSQETFLHRKASQRRGFKSRDP